MSSTSPTTASTGQLMSDSVTRSPWMEKPPLIIRLCAMNCLSSSAIAGPGPRDPAVGREEAALLLPRQQRLAVVQLAQEVEPRLRGLDRVEHLEPGARQPARDVDAGEDVIGHEIGGARGKPGGQVHRQRGQRVDRRAERDDAGEVLGPPVGRGLVGEHPALRVAGKVDVAAGDLLDGVDGLAQRDDMVGEVALHAALDLVGRAEVDDPRVDARLVQDADRAVVAGDVPHVGRHHHRVHHQHRAARRFGAGPGVGREIAPQPVHRHALDDLERRRHRAGFQAAVTQHFQPVLRGGHQPPDRPGYRRQVHHDPLPFCALCQSPDCRRHHGTTHRDHRASRGRRSGATYHRRLMANLINVERATVGYGTRTLLDAVSLGVDEGDAIGVVGRNGDGKTTLLQVLTGTREPDSGRVTHTSGLSVGYCGRPTTSPHHRRSPGHRRRQAGPHLGRRTGHPRRRLASAGRRRPGRRGGAAVGGERRRVALAEVLLAGHDVLVLDEPTNHLDVEVIGWLAGHLTRGGPRRWWWSATTAGSSTRCARGRGRCTTASVDAYDGGYAAYVLARAERMRMAAGTEARRRNLMRKELAWLRRGPPARTSKPKFRIQAANELIANEPPPRDSLVLQRFATTRLGKDVFDLHRVRSRSASRRGSSWTASTGRSGRARASGWSASTAPARRRCCGC